MDIKHYALEAMVRERLAQAREEARRLDCVALVRPRRRFRGRLGLQLIPLGGWLRRHLEPRGAGDGGDDRHRAAHAGRPRAWLAAHGPRHPVIVAVQDDEVVAFGALAPYRTKPSYARTVENSVYVKDGWRGKWLGGLLLDRLLALAREHGHHSVIADHRRQRGLAGLARAARVRPGRARASGRLQARNLAGRPDPPADT